MHSCIDDDNLSIFSVVPFYCHVAASVSVLTAVNHLCQQTARAVSRRWGVRAKLTWAKFTKRGRCPLLERYWDCVTCRVSGWSLASENRTNLYYDHRDDRWPTWPIIFYVLKVSKLLYSVTKIYENHSFHIECAYPRCSIVILLDKMTYTLS